MRRRATAGRRRRTASRRADRALVDLADHVRCRQPLRPGVADQELVRLVVEPGLPRPQVEVGDLARGLAETGHPGARAPAAAALAADDVGDVAGEADHSHGRAGVGTAVVAVLVRAGVPLGRAAVRRAVVLVVADVNGPRRPRAVRPVGQLAPAEVDVLNAEVHAALLATVRGLRAPARRPEATVRRASDSERPFPTAEATSFAVTPPSASSPPATSCPRATDA